MKTYNVIYESKEKLKSYVKKNNICENDNIMIQVFCGVAEYKYIKALLDNIKCIIPQGKIIGSTTAGEIFNGKSVSNKTVISITVFENTEVSTLIFEIDKEKDYECGKHLIKNITKENTKLLIMFASGLEINPEELLKGLESKNYNKIKIAGGLAGDPDGVDKKYVFNDDKILENGVVVVALNSDKLYIYTDFNFNWAPIGKEHIITNCKKNIIKEIDNIPAKKFYEKYIGYMDKEKEDLYGIKFPIMVEKNGQYISNPIMRFTKENELFMASYVKSGQRIKLGYGNVNHILKSSFSIFENVEKNPIESIFIYSCKSRKWLLKSMINFEMEYLNKDISPSGFFTCGEFNYNNGENMFYTETMTLIGLSENEDARISVHKKYKEDFKKISFYNDLAFYNLIKITGDELDELNKNLEYKVKVNTEQLKKKYLTDELTGLYNRSKLALDINEFSLNKLAVIDINAFTQFNDFYGNEAGDKILYEVGRIINLFSKENKLRAYRMYSDVFAVAGCFSIKEYEFIKGIKLLQYIIDEQCFFYRNNKVYIKVTIGITISDEKIIEKADMALNYGKKMNKSIQIYNDKLFILQRYENNLKWSQKLSDAIRDDRLVPFFQPIYNNSNNKIEKYEVLVRIIDENGNIIPPYHFLDVAIKTRQYKELTKIVINKSFDEFRDKDYEFSINLSLDDIEDYDTRNLIFSKLKSFPNSQRVCFEILETQGIDNFKMVKEFIDELHSYGAKVAIDDFGTGYSNFKYLIELNVDYIKIDGSLIKNIHEDNASAIVVETIIEFSKKLDIKTIAEFVHNEDVFNKVANMGVDFSQGYYISQPLEEV